MLDLTQRIADNVARVRQQVADAAERCGRAADEIAVIAVTKYVGEPEIGALVAAGCRQLGESRPQALWQRANFNATADCDWHLVGHLQRNKVRRTLPLVRWVHSVDNLRLLDHIEHVASELELDVAVLLEVNTSGEGEKQGWSAEQLDDLMPRLTGYRRVQIRGLMTMARRTGGPDAAARDFSQLRKLRDRLRRACPPGVTLDQLSMGMSGDFQVAIGEGSTMVRIGSALFEGL